MARKRGGATSSGPSVPDWIMTFSDMTSLLLTFFVLLFTFSTIEEEDLRKISGAKTGGLEPFQRENKPKREVAVSPEPSWTERGEDTRTPHDKAYESARRKLEALGEMGSVAAATDFELSDMGQGMLVEFRPSASFDADSADPVPALVEELEQLAATLGTCEVDIEFGGHAFGFLPTREYATVDELCLARARAAWEIFRRAAREHVAGESKTDAARIRLRSYGESFPRLNFDRSMPEGRQAQRRVTLIVRRLR
jgi:chemotaxis protein MotB